MTIGTVDELMSEGLDELPPLLPRAELLLALLLELLPVLLLDDDESDELFFDEDLDVLDDELDELLVVVVELELVDGGSVLELDGLSSYCATKTVGSWVILSSSVVP